MTELPKTLTFRMPAEASSMGFRQRVTKPLLEVERLRKTFAHAEGAAVERVSLGVGEGELLALLGPSGCGKTTTLRMIGGFEHPDEGRVLFEGQDITHLTPEARGIGFVFQDYALFPHLSVLDNVKFGLRKLPKAEAKARADEMLKLVGLAELGKRRPHQLSGGQQQRLCIARAVATEPEVLLMDEPCSALDPIATAQVEELIDELRQNYSVVIVTHSMQQAARVSQKTAFFHLGNLVEYGETGHIFTNPDDPRPESYITGRIG